MRPFIERDHPPAHGVYQFTVVGGDENGGAVGVDANEEVHGLPAGVGIEVAGGFVSDDDGRPGDKATGDGDPLLLAAGELIGMSIGLEGEADGFERLLDPTAAVVVVVADDAEANSTFLATVASGRSLKS